MPELPEGSRIATNINDIAALVTSLRSGVLDDLLTAAGNVADCTNHCGCHQGACACNRIVANDDWEDLTYPQFLQMRQRRIDELRLRLRALEEGPPSEPDGPDDPR